MLPPVFQKPMVKIISGINPFPDIVTHVFMYSISQVGMPQFLQTVHSGNKESLWNYLVPPATENPKW
jgi:hypothetical protein